METGPTRGHELFERWLIETYGASTRRPGRPCYDGLKQAHRLISDEVRSMSRHLRVEIGGRAAQLRPPQAAIALYHWIASAQPTARKTPRRHIRTAIEAITGGSVPRDAWEMPAQMVAA